MTTTDTMQGPQREAATALAGLLISLFLADRRETGLHLIDALDTDMAGRVNTELDMVVHPGLVDALAGRATGTIPADITAAPSRSWTDRTRDALETILGRYAPGVDMDVLTCDDAYQPLVSRIMDRCVAEDVDPLDVLRRVSPRDLAASEGMDSAAAWLTAKVRDLPETEA